MGQLEMPTFECGFPEHFYMEFDKAGELKFRAWAREHYDPNDTTKKPNPSWHPVILDECQKMWVEAGTPLVEADAIPG